MPSIKLASRIKEIEKAYEILSTVGTKNPKIDAPHVPLEVLIEGEGEKVIQQVIATGDIPMSGGLSGENVVVEELAKTA